MPQTEPDSYLDPGRAFELLQKALPADATLTLLDYKRLPDRIFVAYTEDKRISREGKITRRRVSIWLGDRLVMQSIVRTDIDGGVPHRH